MNTYIEELINNIKNNNNFKIKKLIKLEELLYKDKNNKYLLEYMLEYNINYYYSLIPGLNSNVKAIEIFCKYNKLDLIFGIKSDVLIKNVDNNICLLEYIIRNNMVNKIKLNSLDYNDKLIDIIIKYNLKELMQIVIFKENDIVNCLELLIKSNYINYVKFPLINYHSEIIDTLVKYNRLDIIIKIMFSENLLINEGLLIKLINLKCTPVISHCSNKIIDYLYKLNRPDIMINYFKDSNNINCLFNKINNKYIIDYLLKYDLDFRFIGINGDYLNKNEYILLYIKFSTYDKLDYLENLSKDELLKKNNDNVCLLDLFIKYNLDECLKILKFYELDKDVDIVAYLKLNNISFGNNVIIDRIDKNEFSSYPLEYINKYIENEINYDKLGEDKVELLIRLEELLISNDNKELVDTLVLSYAKELNKGNEYAYIELKKLIKIIEEHPECKVNKSNYSYFNENDGLHLSLVEINNINHELGHLFHYYLVNDEIPNTFKKLLISIRNRSDLIDKVNSFSKSITEYESNLMKSIEIEYDNWAKDYYTLDKLEEIKYFINSSKDNKIKLYKKLGYDEDKLNNILDSTISLDLYLKSDKKIKCEEMLRNTMCVYNSEVNAISDIIDAIFGGLFYNSMLYNSDGEKIDGKFGHGILYYNSNDIIFQEIFANYCLLIKSDRSNKTFNILKELVGDELIKLLDEFYSEMINNNKYIDVVRRSL